VDARRRAGGLEQRKKAGLDSWRWLFESSPGVHADECLNVGQFMSIPNTN
jgi:hypothetical protein